MSKRKTKPLRFCGYTVSRTVMRDILSLIEMTTGPLGAHKRAFKTELQFWDAISLVTGWRKSESEFFEEAIIRIARDVRVKGREWRAAQVNSVDMELFRGIIGVKPTHIVVTHEEIEANARRYASKRDRKSAPPPKSLKEDFYKSWEWRTLRLKALQEHGRVCLCCGNRPGMFYASGEPVRIVVDHIKPISKYWHLRLDPTNLQPLCDECNQGKGNWDETDFRSPEAPDEWVEAPQDDIVLSVLDELNEGTLQ